MSSDTGTPDQLLAYLDTLSIPHQTISHPPLCTVEEAKMHRPQIPGGYTKNLFLRNRKGAMWLLTLQEDQSIDLKQAAEHLEAKQFSFASAERLQRYLGITPGAVSPLALFNDRNDHLIQFVLDTAFKAHEWIHVHPLNNQQTTTLRLSDLERFLIKTGHPPQWVDFSALAKT